MCADRQYGFSLIELVIVMIVISVGLLGLTGMFGNVSTSLSTNETLQKATQYAQECAEKVIATRRDDVLGFASTSISNTMCNTTADTPAGLLPVMDTGFGRTVSVGNLYSGTGTAPDPCPIGTDNCKNVTITVTHSTLSPTIITLMLVKY